MGITSRWNSKTERLGKSATACSTYARWHTHVALTPWRAMHYTSQICANIPQGKQHRVQTFLQLVRKPFRTTGSVGVHYWVLFMCGINMASQQLLIHGMKQNLTEAKLLKIPRDSLMSSSPRENNDPVNPIVQHPHYYLSGTVMFNSDWSSHRKYNKIYYIWHISTISIILIQSMYNHTLSKMYILDNHTLWYAVFFTFIKIIIQGKVWRKRIKYREKYFLVLKAKLKITEKCWLSLSCINQ